MKKSFVQLLDPAQFRAMAWKNGRGHTLEIDVDPPGAGLESESLRWRLSSATISEPSEFSLFPGFNRFLTLTEGEELLLAGAENMRLRSGDVYHFSGDKNVRADLPSGTVRDLGLLYRREMVKADMSVVDFSRPRSFRLDFPITFFFVISGSFSASCYPGEKRFELKTGSALKVEAPSGESERLVLLEPLSSSARVAAIEIR